MRLLLLSFVLIPLKSLSQNSTTARVVILNPQEFVADQALLDSIPKYTLTEEQVLNCITNLNQEDDRDFAQRMNKLQCEFMREMNASSEFTLYLNTWMTFKLYGIFDDAIIYPIRAEVKTKKDYKKIAKQHKIDWVLNLKKIDVQNKSGTLIGVANIELWNQKTNGVILSTEIEIDSKNHFGEMSCDEGTFNCIVSNGSAYITDRVLKSMFSKKEYWR